MDIKEKKKTVSPVVYLVGVTVLFLLLMSVKSEIRASETSFGEVVKQNMAKEFAGSVMGKFASVLTFSQNSISPGGRLAEQSIKQIIPIYGYSRELQGQEQMGTEESEHYLSMEGMVPVENTVPETNIKTETTEQPIQETADSMQELMMAENEAVLQAAEFLPHVKQATVDLPALASYETLVSMFYSIDANTMAGSEQLNAEKLLGRNLILSKEGEGPQILIYHTHSQEGFADSVPGDMNTTIVGVGARLAELLQNQYGYRVLHHTGQYDVESRDDAYAHSLPAIEKLLAENPSIEVVIDLHRDSMPEETKLVMDLDGRPTARFMFFNGLSRTKNTGNIAYLYNENQEDNLAFSFQMQLKAMEYYPGLTRKIYLKGYRYNMHLRPRTTLIELGAQNNTVEEAMNACDPLAHIIDMVLSGST